MSTIARQCARFVLTLVGNLTAEEAFKLEDGFEAILAEHNAPTVPGKLLAVKPPKRRRLKVPKHLDDAERRVIIDKIVRGENPQTICRTHDVSPSVTHITNLVNKEPWKNLLTVDQREILMERHRANRARRFG